MRRACCSSTWLRSLARGGFKRQGRDCLQDLAKALILGKLLCPIGQDVAVTLQMFAIGGKVGGDRLRGELNFFGTVNHGIDIDFWGRELGV